VLARLNAIGEKNVSLLPHDSVEERYSAGAEAGEDVAAIGCEEIAVGRPRDTRAGAPARHAKPTSRPIGRGNRGIRWHRLRLTRSIQYAERSLMLVTALVPAIGYDKASRIAHPALEHDLTLERQACRSASSMSRHSAAPSIRPRW
jgi:hypothetical protein